LTDSAGSYSFADLLPDNYTVVQTNLDGFIDVSDQDEVPDGDIFDNDTNVDNTINVTLNRGEVDTGNNFVDIKLGNITGSVTDTAKNNLDGVLVFLQDEFDNVFATTLTDSTGSYSFINIEPGNYTIGQKNLPGFNNTSDQDEQVDGDISDNDTTVDNMINVTLNAGETDAGNNFVDVQLGNITGSVTDSTGASLDNILIVLKDESDITIRTTLTDAIGSYSFTNLLPDNYTVMQTNLNGFDDVSDQDEQADGDIFDIDTTVDNIINVTLNPGETDAGNDFVDIELGSISGSVTDSDGGNLDGVVILLIDDEGNTFRTTLTDSTGSYSFVNVPPNNYTVAQTNLPGFNDISDQDEQPDGDIFDIDTTVDSIINVTLNPGESDTGNNFVDVELGSINGTVQDSDGNTLNGVTIVLKDQNNVTIRSTLTDSSGSYGFTNLEPDNYTVIQTNLVAFADISDQDEAPDGDIFDNDTTVDNMINVTLNAGETDVANNFVDLFTPPSSAPSLSPSDSPSTLPSVLPSKQPSSSPSQSPSALPSTEPSNSPSSSPSSPFPSAFPSVSPSLMPSSYPSSTPTKLPSSSPSDVPSLSPSESPSDVPSVSPTDVPTRLPSFQPSASPNACDDFSEGKSSANTGTRSRKLQFFWGGSGGNNGETGSSGNNSGFGSGGFGGGGFGDGPSGGGNGGFGGGGFGGGPSGGGGGGFGGGGFPSGGGGFPGGGGFGQGNSNSNSNAGGTAGGGGGGSSSIGSSGEGAGSTVGAGEGGGSAAGCTETNTSGNGEGSGAGNNSGGGGFGSGTSNNPFAGNGQSNGEAIGGGGGLGGANSNTSGNAGGTASGGGTGFGNGQGLGTGNSGGFGVGGGVEG